MIASLNLLVNLPAERDILQSPQMISEKTTAGDFVRLVIKSMDIRSMIFLTTAGIKVCLRHFLSVPSGARNGGMAAPCSLKGRPSGLKPHRI